MGMEYNTTCIRRLAQRDVELTVLPWEYPFAAYMHLYDDLLLSNGPGDLNMSMLTVQELEKSLP